MQRQRWLLPRPHAPQVCDSRFSDREADVVCRQLNLPTPGRAIGAAFHGPGTGPIHLAGADCTAFQNRLVQCNAKWGVPGTCTHAQVRGGQPRGAAGLGQAGAQHGALERNAASLA